MIKKPECKDIIQVVLPAVRASVAEELHSKHGYSQEQIANKLGVVQVAISKYLHGKYSKDILRMKKYILQQGLSDNIVKRVLKSNDRKQIDNQIDELCDRLVAVETIK